MKKRIITGAVLAIVLGLLIYFGEGKLSFLFSGFCVLLSLAASYEFTKMSRNKKAIRWFDFIAVIMTGIFSTLSVIFFDQIIFYKYIYIFLLSIILFYTFLFISIKDFTRLDFSNQILTIFYSSLGFISFAYLRRIDINLIIYLLLVAMITDVFAYFIGIQFGRHRLAVNISPKKSIEGAIGGMIFGTITASLYGYFFKVFTFDYIYIILLSIALSCISQIGDLIASKFKREANIKDYSNLFPGHGGVLDRFDSSMFAAIFLMLAVILF